MNLSPVEVYLNTKYATLKMNGTKNSDMLFYFTNPIQRVQGYVMKLKLLNFVFPVSFYLVNDDNNSLVIDDTTYTLTHGVYSATTLKTHIASLIPNTYTLTYDSITNRYTFENSEYGGEFTINKESSCLTLIGFSEDTDHSSSSYTLTSDLVVNLSGQYNIVYFDIPNIRINNLSSSTGRLTSVLKSIPVSTAYGNVMYHEDQSESYTRLQDDAVSFFHVRILGEDLATAVDFNGQEWNATLQIQFEKVDGLTDLNKMNFSQAYSDYVQKINPQFLQN